MEPMWAIILDIWKDEPIFHGSNRDVRNISGGEVTSCGRQIAPYKPWLPRKHAEKFARPCKGCFSG